MDRRQTLTAAELINSLGADELGRVFALYGGETSARLLARRIAERRAEKPFETTGDLAAFISKLIPRRGRRHPATRVFQALRIAVNSEMESLEKGLASAMDILRSGGRLAVITFHSLEDRLVKNFMRNAARDYAVPGGEDIPELRRPVVPRARLASRQALVPSADEIARNPRARSAQLRVLEKI